MTAIKTTLRTLASWDAALGACAGSVAVTLALVSDGVRDSATPVLFAEAAGGAGFLATVLTALGIIAVSFDGAYRRVLEQAHPRGVADALAPYAATAWVSGAAGVIALLGALAWPALGTAVGAAVLGCSTGLAVWALAGIVQLTGITTAHLRSRADLQRALDVAAEGSVGRRRAAAPRARARSDGR